MKQIELYLLHVLTSEVARPFALSVLYHSWMDLRSLWVSAEAWMFATTVMKSGRRTMASLNLPACHTARACMRRDARAHAEGDQTYTCKHALCLSPLDSCPFTAPFLDCLSYTFALRLRSGKTLSHGTEFAAAKTGRAADGEPQRRQTETATTYISAHQAAQWRRDWHLFSALESGTARSCNRWHTDVT